MSVTATELTGPRCSPESEMSAPSAASRMAENIATVKDAINARKKLVAPVMVPTCDRATAFCDDTVETGKAVPNPNANIDSNTSNTHSGIGASINAAAAMAATIVPMIATRL